MLNRMNPTLLVALMLAGCAAPASIAPPERVALAPAPAAAEGGPLDVTIQQVPPGTSVAASSSAAAYPTANITDGVETSAWSPGTGDTMPWVQFDLDQPMTLDSIGVKLSLGANASASDQRVYVAVQSSSDGSTWTTLAFALTPSETVLTTLNLPDTAASAVRVSFLPVGANSIAGLRVCEVQVNAAAPADTGTDGPPGDGGGGGGGSTPGGGNGSTPGGGNGGGGNDDGNGGGGNGGGGGGGNGNSGVGNGGGGGNGTSNEGNGNGNGNGRGNN